MLNDLARQINETSTKKGFWDGDRNVPEVLMLVVSELAEALEVYRSGIEGLALREVWTSEGKPEGFPTELADAIIRILDACHAYGIDIEAAIEVKMKYNEERPFKHGKIC